jgi:hypothetical protein
VPWLKIPLALVFYPHPMRKSPSQVDFPKRWIPHRPMFAA